MKSVAVVTAKRFTQAKQRLAGSVSAELRRELVEAMLGDVLEAVSKSRMISDTVVVTGEEAAASLAESFGAHVVHDPDDISHSEAALMGVARAEQLGAECVTLLPGDCPLLDPRELDSVLTGLPNPYVAVVPDRHGTGTNALVLVPPRAIRPAFGEGSCARHLDLASQAGIPHSLDELPTLSLDLDTPADIVALTSAIDMAGGQAVRTAKVLGI